MSGDYDGERFGTSVFLVFFNRVVAAIFAFCMALVKGNKCGRRIFQSCSNFRHLAQPAIRLDQGPHHHNHVEKTSSNNLHIKAAYEGEFH